MILDPAWKLIRRTIRTASNGKRALIGVVLFLSAQGVCAQQIELSTASDPAFEDYDFSWVYWFETHGRGYLHEAVEDRPLPWDTPASRRWRGDVTDALQSLLDDTEDEVRAAAVLSLARMGYERLLDRLLPGAAGTGRVSLLLDASQDVRLSAWAALGLLDTPESRAALAAEPFEKDDEAASAAQAMAIGLLATLDQTHRRWLVARLDDADESLEVKRWCVWSLGRHDDAGIDPVFDAVLRTLPSTFLIGQVLLEDAYVTRRGGADQLIDVMRYHPAVRGWAGYRALSAMPAEGLHGSTPRRLAMQTRVAAALTLADAPRPARAEDRRELLSQLRRRMVAGNSTQAMDFNRGFDTIAYFMHCDADTEDLALLYDQLRGFAALASDDPGMLDGLAEGAKPTPADLRVRQSDNEVRCYTALATGLLIRRATSGTALNKERPIEGRRAIEIERLKRRFGIRLMRAVADEDEPMAYRAACALAIGLSADDRYVAELAEELGKLRGGDEPVLGYGLLALAMLGHERTAEPARRYVTRPGLVRGIDDQLGRRAALRSLAIIGEGGGANTTGALSGAWGRDVWVSLSAAEAAGWAGDYAALPTMLEATQSESTKWRWAAAVSLGLVFDNAFPSRLSPLIERINPTMAFRPYVLDGEIEDETARGWPMPRLHALGDRFVFEVMRKAPSRGGETIQEAQ